MIIYLSVSTILPMKMELITPIAMNTLNGILVLSLSLTFVHSTNGLLIDLPDFNDDAKSSGAVDPNAIKIFVNRWAEDWATNVNNQDAQAMADTYTEDAVYHEEGHAVASNKREIFSDYENWFDLGAKNGLLWIGGYGPVGDGAIFVWGKYTVGNEDQSLPHEKGKFVTIMKAVPNGSKDIEYKIYRDFVFH